MLRHMPGNHLDEALVLYRHGVDVLRDAAGPDRIDVQRDAAEGIALCAATLKAEGRTDEAKALVRTLIEHGRKLAAGPSAGQERRRAGVQVGSVIAGSLSLKGWHGESQALLRTTLAEDLDDPMARNALAWALASPADCTPRRGPRPPTWR